MNKWKALLLAGVCTVGGGAAAAASPAEPGEARPAITARVGGSLADAEFRAAIQKSGDDFRAAKAACRSRPSAERSVCLKEANDTLKKTRANAKVVHEEAKKAERAEKK